VGFFRQTIIFENLYLTQLTASLIFEKLQYCLIRLRMVGEKGGGLGSKRLPPNDSRESSQSHPEPDNEISVIQKNPYWPECAS
jgi:hypothetical protein